MSVYVLSEVEIKDPVRGDAYRTIAARTIEQYGGRYVVRAGKKQVLEGTWSEHEAVVIVEFPDEETAKRWYTSPEYAEALAIRQTALTRRLVLLDGVK